MTLTSRAVTMRLPSCLRRTSRIAIESLMTLSGLSIKVPRFPSCALKSTQWNCRRLTTARLWVSTLEIKDQPLPQPTNSQTSKKELIRWKCADLLAKRLAGTTTSNPSPSTTLKSTPLWGSPSNKFEKIYLRLDLTAFSSKGSLCILHLLCKWP